MDIFERLSDPILPLPGRKIIFRVLSNEMKRVRSFMEAQTTEQQKE